MTKLRTLIMYVFLFSLGLSLLYMLRTMPKLSLNNAVFAREGSADNGVVAHQSVAQAVSGPGGIYPYAMAMAMATSLKDMTAAVASWSDHVQRRTQWELSSSAISRLAVADFNARQSGSPTITPSQVADALSSAVNAKLSTMSDSEAKDLLQQMTSEKTPRGSWAPNSFNSAYYTISHNEGNFAIKILPEAITGQKNLYSSMMPKAINSSSNLYPSEAQLVVYALASGDLGYGDSTLAALKVQISLVTGSDMTNRSLFGSNGYLARRPLSAFMDENFTNAFYSQMGF